MGSTVAVRLVLADASSLVRSGLRSVLGAEPDLVVVGEAADGPAAVELARRLSPDILVADLGLPRGDALFAQLAGLTAQVMFLADPEPDGGPGFAALRGGAAAVVPRDLPGPALAGAIRTVAAGQAVLARSALRRLLTAPAPAPAAASRDYGLTGREREVLAQLARGRSNAEIAGALGVGETTVKTHVGRVLAKLGARDRAAAVVLAYDAGLARPGGAAGAGLGG